MPEFTLACYRQLTTDTDKDSVFWNETKFMFWLSVNLR